jgi:hydrogenase 3 maturation protease
MLPKPPPSMPLLRSLRTLLDDAQRVVVLGVGSDLRGDDAAGVLVAARLLEALGMDDRRGGPEVLVLDGSTAPENLTGPIKRFEPTHVVIVDSAIMGLEPGAVEMLRAGEAGGVPFCTHALPISVTADYLVAECGAWVGVIGIQPQDVGFGVAVTPAVEAAVAEVAAVLAELLA